MLSVSCALSDFQPMPLSFYYTTMSLIEDTYNYEAISLGCHTSQVAWVWRLRENVRDGTSKELPGPSNPHHRLLC